MPKATRFSTRAIPAILLSLGVVCIALAANDSAVNPDDPAYLRRQFAWFIAQDPARQQQLRKLHAEFQELPADEQAHLARVMQAYNAWLTKLPEADRQRVLNAPNSTARIDEIKRLREREWVDAQPKAIRDEYARLDDDARRQRVHEWRVEDVERRDEWAVAQRNWGEFPLGKVPQMFLNESRKQIDDFVAHLKDNLVDTERRDLEDAKIAFEEFGNVFWYAREIVRLADLHPILPSRNVGPRDFATLPDSVRNELIKHNLFGKKKLAQGDEPKELRRFSGRWPDYCVEVVRYCQRNKVNLPQQLGDCRKEQMPLEVVQFLEQLKKTPEGRADLEVLKKAEGAWPDYPKMIVDLARKHKLQIPGWTLPGQPQAWDRLRAVKPRKI